LRIAKINAIPVSISVRLPGLLHGPTERIETKADEHVIVKIYSDDGLVGLGESQPIRTGMRMERSARAIVELINRVAPLLVGVDPFEIRPLFRKMDKVVSGCAWAKAGLDIALFDLMGKASKKPISALLGGSFRQNLPVEFPLTERRGDPQKIGEEASRATRLGYTFLELKAGTDPVSDVERVRAVREAIGNNPRLKVDINEGYKNASVAITTIKKMERFDVDFVEQPLAGSDIRGMAKVAEAVDVKIVADETAATLPALVENIIRRKSADAVHIKVCKGGIVDTMRMITVAEAAGIIPIVGAAYSFGVGIAAVHQVAATIAELQRPDHYGRPFYVDDILSSPIKEENGYVTISQKPGLGIDLDQQKLEALRAK